jgi:tRNA-binding EMAP/Myf-like protein
LKSQFNDSLLGRLIGAYVLMNFVGKALGRSMYAYCANNPVMYTDSDGYMATWLKVVFVSIAVIAVITAVIILAPAVIAAASATAAFATVGGTVVGASVVATSIATADVLTALALLTIAGVSIAMVDSDGMIIHAKPTGKEKASDKPSWVNRGMIDQTLSAHENAENLLNSKYGKGGRGSDRGPGSEYSQIVKWIVRSKIIHDMINLTTKNNTYQDWAFIYDKWGVNP